MDGLGQLPGAPGAAAEANAFLTSVSYAGPGSCPISGTLQAQAKSLAQTLDNQTNDSTSTTC